MKMSENVLFIVIDCLREDVLSSEQTDTPFLDSLIDNGVYFENMFATTTTTTPSVASILTGCYSETNGINTHSDVALNEEIDTLAEMLKKAGYSTYAMPTGPLVTETELDRGFDNYWYRDRNEHLHEEWGEQAKDRITSLDEPFFLFMHLWELHRPVYVPSEYDTDAYGKYPYTRALSALDRELEQLMKHVPEDTTVILHGDHGESITWRKSLGHQTLRERVREELRYEKGYDTRIIERIIEKIADFVGSNSIPDRYLEDGHGENISDFTTNVPFLIYTGDGWSGSVQKQVRQVDIYPTILDLLDINLREKAIMDGDSLLPIKDLTDRIAYMRACGLSLHGERNWKRGIRMDEMKYVEYPNKDWSPELYDLEADPSEINPIEDQAVIGKMQENIPDKELMDVDRIEIDDLLRDLGYL